MARDIYCIGIDFGSDSVRAVIVNAQNGEEAASAMFHYPRWKDGLYCNASANQFRQHPLDYIEGMVSSVTSALREAGDTVRSGVRAISIATTGSTPAAVDKTGTPLALHPDFTRRPRCDVPALEGSFLIERNRRDQCHMQKNSIPIIYVMSAGFILRNGTGPNSYIFSAIIR